MADMTEDYSADSIRRAATRVLGNSPTGREIVQLCDAHTESVRWISEQRVTNATTVAVVGATGQGKSWLVRQFVRDPAVLRAVRSGETQGDATRRLYWIGPQPPAALDQRYESYLYCAQDSMLDLGGPYLIVDTPGATDLDPATVEAAARAVSMASVLILMVRREQLRSEVPGRLAEASEGTLVLPVVNVVRSPTSDPQLRSDVDALLARLRTAAPRGEILAAVLVPDFDLSDSDETAVGEQVAHEVADSLRSHMASGDVGNRRRSLRLQAEQDRFLKQIGQVLAVDLPHLSLAVEHLERATASLPHDVAVELIGSGQALRAGIRSRLRADMLVATAAIWFPYRTLLGLLNLTHGAWDRVVLALSGSLPSLVGAAWTSVRNVNEGRQAADSVSSAAAIRQRSFALISERIIPLVHRFRTELARLHSGADSDRTPADAASAEASPVSMLGIDSLVERTQRIFDEEITHAAPRPWMSQVCGLIGTLIFWCLLAGPIVSLYRTYFAASYESLWSLSENLERFPHPSAAMVATSILLSVLPTALFAMLVLTWIQRRGRLESAAARIDARIKESIDQLQTDGVLRLEFRDPLLEDARRLLRAGRASGGQRPMNS